MEKEIGRIHKGEYQGNITEIVIGIKEFNGRIGVDIREFSKSEQYTGPTKKGLRIPAESFEEFRTMVNSINPDDLKGEPAQEKLPDIPKQEKENSGINEEGLM